MKRYRAHLARLDEHMLMAWIYGIRDRFFGYAK
jgi:hypothetical protein